MPTHPYIHFQGQCAAAMTACAAIFGSAPPQRMHDADAPGAPGAFKASGRIMPAQVALFDGTLMGSDYPPGREGEAQKRVSVMQSAPNFDTGARIFAALAKGGAVIEDHNSSFFAKGFGRVEDRLARIGSSRRGSRHRKAARPAFWAGLDNNRGASRHLGEVRN